jgi:hypothetical protein
VTPYFDDKLSRVKMQLNGTSGPTMAASEPPEPPPRNPDKINASLKQFNEMVRNHSLLFWVCTGVTDVFENHIIIFFECATLVFA